MNAMQRWAPWSDSAANRGAEQGEEQSTARSKSVAKKPGFKVAGSAAKWKSVKTLTFWSQRMGKRTKRTWRQFAPGEKQPSWRAIATGSFWLCSQRDLLRFGRTFPFSQLRRISLFGSNTFLHIDKHELITGETVKFFNGWERYIRILATVIPWRAE